MEQWGGALQFCPKELREDKAIVTKAVLQDYESLRCPPRQARERIRDASVPLSAILSSTPIEFCLLFRV